MKKVIVIALILLLSVPAFALAQSGFYFDNRGNNGIYVPPPNHGYSRGYQQPLPRLDTRGPDIGGSYLRGQQIRRQQLENELLEQELRERQRRSLQEYR